MYTESMILVLENPLEKKAFHTITKDISLHLHQHHLCVMLIALDILEVFMTTESAVFFNRNRPIYPVASISQASCLYNSFSYMTNCRTGMLSINP